LKNKRQRIKISDLPQNAEISKKEIRDILGGANIGLSFMSPGFHSALNIRMGLEAWRSTDLVSRIMNQNKLAMK
jgi:hypothetical protein